MCGLPRMLGIIGITIRPGFRTTDTALFREAGSAGVITVSDVTVGGNR